MKKTVGAMLCIAGILPALTFSPEAMTLPAYCIITACGLALAVYGCKMANIYIKENER